MVSVDGTGVVAGMDQDWGNQAWACCLETSLILEDKGISVLYSPSCPSRHPHGYRPHSDLLPGSIL